MLVSKHEIFFCEKNFFFCLMDVFPVFFPSIFPVFFPSIFSPVFFSSVRKFYSLYFFQVFSKFILFSGMVLTKFKWHVYGTLFTSNKVFRTWKNQIFFFPVFFPSIFFSQYFPSIVSQYFPQVFFASAEKSKTIEEISIFSKFILFIRIWRTK